MAMYPRRKMSFGCTLLWTIMGLVVSSSGRPSDTTVGEPMSPSTSSQTNQDVKMVQLPSVVVPQIGVLEDRPNVGASSQMGLQPSVGTSENGGKGILVPIVSVVDGDSPSKTNGNLNSPLVALLPAPLSADPQISMLPKIPNLPVLPYDNQPLRPAKPEIRRSVNTGNDDDRSGETMDVAEDIVFRPLFKIRPNAGKNSYALRNNGRNYRNDYRRYNVNGYYRVPYNYFRSDDRDRYDYS